MSRSPSEWNRSWCLAAYVLAVGAPLLLPLLVSELALDTLEYVGPGTLEQSAVGGSGAARPVATVMEVAAAAAEFSKLLITLASGLAVAMAVTFQKRRKPTKRRNARVAFVVGMGLTLASVYTGLRFQLDLTWALTQTNMQISRLWHILQWQGGFMILQVSTLSFLAVDYYLQQDRRHADI
jgi:hypothetical protein